MTLEDWFYAMFDGYKHNYSYPATTVELKDNPIKCPAITYVFSRLSTLDALRSFIKNEPPIPPIVPVIAIDGPVNDAPKHIWIGLTSNDLHWYDGLTKKEAYQIDPEKFNDTIAAMNLLYVRRV